MVLYNSCPGGEAGMATKGKYWQIMELIEKDGWVLKGKRGSHRQYFHPAKKGCVTINGKPTEDVPVWLWYAILRQAGLR